ncbi:class I SAM-dependent methyltransferase [Leptolyngbya cf. ectocarpi LEGE 11479]|uniref:Class I SAM-dependent methyltransferase n=1 Tax=Leptolyngbya cf. ectocarpi LEGE 11479 TaxID=1828722 RepID=A0A928ZQ46_LEPEC|nr:class I SAM-dependent methyltransferase [Leptolyngbya ectocarpi]MBE9065875.1 class I SAM-dependent methyltransferase [Leptolyngbya cf. ectocarpi LEGE 11479]
MDYHQLKQAIDGYASRELTQRKVWYSSAADAYNQVRPSYPTALVARVMEVAQLSTSSSILEVGCGPGTATVSFAPLVSSMVCVEPNSDFTRLAQQNCQAYPSVTVHNTSFEEWPVATARFDAVLAATSFHWIPAAVSYPKAAQALKDQGRLILLWNNELRPSYEIYQRFAPIYQRHAPSLARYEDKRTQEKILQNLGDIMVESGHFSNMVSGHMTSNVTYTSLEYLSLLTTYSPYLELESPVRQALLADLKTLIDQEFAGKLELSYISAFHIAQKAES